MKNWQNNWLKDLKDLFVRMSIKSNKKIKSRSVGQKNPARFCLDASFQGIKRLFVLAFNSTVVDIANNPTELKETATEYNFF